MLAWAFPKPKIAIDEVYFLNDSSDIVIENLCFIRKQVIIKGHIWI